MWGPEGYSGLVAEHYLESPDFERDTQYFDKSRMEIIDPGANPDDTWFATNGLLALELMTGNLQFGDDAFLQLEPAVPRRAGLQVQRERCLRRRGTGRDAGKRDLW